MPEMIKVRAVPGRLCPQEGNDRGHVGYRPATDDEEADHVIPCGTVVVNNRSVRADKRLKRIEEAVEVPNTVFYRRAIACGDIVRDDQLVTKNALVTAPEKAAALPADGSPDEPLAAESSTSETREAGQ